jgi:hypothetical protein
VRNQRKVVCSPIQLHSEPRAESNVAKKEAKRAERAAKAAVKNVPTASTSTAPKKEKVVKEKKEAPPAEEWINPTPKGEKKGTCN